MQIVWMRKGWVRVVAAAVAVLLVLVVAIPLLVDVDRFRPRIETEIAAALGRPVQLGHLSLSVFSGSLIARQVSIGDDPNFSKSPALTAKELRIGVRISPLLLKRQLRVTGVTIASPTMQLIESADGRWNFSNLGRANTTPSTPQSAPAPTVSVDELKIVGGRATVVRLSAQKPALEITSINLTVRNLSPASSFPFKLVAELSGGGSVTAEGHAGPLAADNSVLTPLDARIVIKHFDVEKFGGLLAQSGMAGLLDLETQVASSKGQLCLKGKVKAEHLKLARAGSPAREPVQLEFALSDDLAAHTVQVEDVALHAGSVAAHLTGTLKTVGTDTQAETQLNLKLAAHEMSIDGLENLLPAVGITLPRGSQLKGGTATADFAVTGTAERMVIEGPVVASNTVLAGYDLGAHIGGVNPFAGNGAGTRVQTLRMQVRVTPEGEQLTNIFGDLPQVGTATGAGTISAQQALNFDIVAKFAPTTGVGQLLGQGVKVITGFLGHTLHSKAEDGVPVTIQGTASDPQIHAHLGQMLKRVLSSNNKGKKK